MNAAVGLMDGLGLDGDRCIRVIPRHNPENQAPRFLLQEPSGRSTWQGLVGLLV